MACFTSPMDYLWAIVVKYLLFKVLNTTQFSMMPRVCCGIFFFFFLPPSTVADEGAWTQSRHLWLRAGRCWLIDCEGKCERFNTQRQIWSKPVCACCLTKWLIWLCLPLLRSVCSLMCVCVCVGVCVSAHFQANSFKWNVFWRCFITKGATDATQLYKEEPRHGETAEKSKLNRLLSNKRNIFLPVPSAAARFAKAQKCRWLFYAL